MAPTRWEVAALFGVMFTTRVWRLTFWLTRSSRLVLQHFLLWEEKWRKATTSAMASNTSLAVLGKCLVRELVRLSQRSPTSEAFACPNINYWDAGCILADDVELSVAWNQPFS